MIDVLLSTYNGEKYVIELLKSLENQTYKDFQVIIRDDCSKDNTIDIINEFIKVTPLKITLLTDNINLGPTKSFESLVKTSHSDYFMFCDQDDVWLPTKIENTYKKIKELEEKQGEGLPYLVFSDLKVVDSSLNAISDSFFSLQKTNPDVCHNIWKCIAISVVPGCTMLMNKQCKKYILPIPSFRVHDHWAICNIAYYGKCDYISEPTILYRIHSNNTIGIQNPNKKNAFRKISAFKTLLPMYWKELHSYQFDVKYRTVIFYKIYYFIKRFLIKK